MHDRRRRVGVVGMGYWSERHLNAWVRHADARIAALCDRDPARLAQRGDRYGVPEPQRYQSVDRMLREADLDVVDIITRPDTHLALVREAAVAGKHILCQKPFAPDLRQATEMVDAAREAGVRLMVTENYRWERHMQCLKRLLEDGGLGHIHTARFFDAEYYTPGMTPGAKMHQPYLRDMPRLLLYEMGVHWLDMWRFLFGMPTRVYARLARISPHIAGEDAGTVILEHEGMNGLMDVSWASRRGLMSRGSGAGPGEGAPPQWVMEGEGGTVIMYADGRIARSNPGGDEVQTLMREPIDYEETFFILQKHFLECLRSGEPFQTSAQDNLETLRLTFAVYQSAASSQPVEP